MPWKKLGLIEFVPHLVEADNDQAAMLHPFGWDGGEPAEMRLAIATHEWTRALTQISELSEDILVSAKKHLGEIAMVGCSMGADNLPRRSPAIKVVVIQ